MHCRICNSNNLKLFYQQGNKNQFKFYKCKDCGLINLDLTGLEITEHQHQYFERFVPPHDYEEEKGAYHAYRFIKKYVPVGERYLDIGCGWGRVLYFARKDGWKVKGIEISPQYAEYVQDRLNIEVDVADFLQYENPGEKFDLVSLRHVLEHLPDSLLAMKKINELLKDNGYAHFEFPNINSVSHRLKRFLSRSGIHKKKYSPTYKPGHCNEFSKKTFIYLLNKTGFQLIRWETYSFKQFNDFIYNRIHIGTKARAIVKKV
jgi:2-polyprenyl-3-methyl-5-hydroxy-6-metoxy-1,4-benzoquinol methylase